MKSSTKHKYVLGMDPSGNFEEGYGTTGWCVQDCDTLEIVECGDISARDFKSRTEYHQAHIRLIQQMRLKYKPLKVLSIEDYVLYPNRSREQSLSKMETPRLLGVLEYWCMTAHMEYFTRNAVTAKKRWTDEILVRKHILESKGDKLFAAGRITNDHIRDSIRHATHFSVFENGGR
jgi:hypothetical protein